MKTHISVDTKIKVGLIGFGRMGRILFKRNAEKRAMGGRIHLQTSIPIAGNWRRNYLPNRRYWKTNRKCSMMKVCR